MRYTWTIRTGDVWYAGTDANIFLALNGSDAVMKEVQIDDPNSINDWEKGEVNSGTVETEDLGELQSGILRTDQSGASAGWYVDWVKIRNEEDGREWTAQVGAWSDHNGRDGRFRLKFALSDPGDYERMQKEKATAAAKQAAKDAAAKAKADAEAAAARKAKDEADAAAREAQADADLQRQLDDQQRQLDRELKRLDAEKRLAEKRAELEKLKNPGGSSSGGGAAGSLRTFELFGMMGGNRVPLSSAVAVDRATGAARVMPGARVLVTTTPGEGFGLSGMPGSWQFVAGGQSPAAYGLDPDKGVVGSDGTRGWPLDAQFLSQVFGSGWRMAVYS